MIIFKMIISHEISPSYLTCPCTIFLQIEWKIHGFHLLKFVYVPLTWKMSNPTAKGIILTSWLYPKTSTNIRSLKLLRADLFVWVTQRGHQGFYTSSNLFHSLEIIKIYQFRKVVQSNVSSGMRSNCTTINVMMLSPGAPRTI